MDDLHPDKLDEFLQSLRAQSANVISGNGEDLAELFKHPSPFRVVCMRCEMVEPVEIIADRGGCGSEWTGSWPGSLTLKCRNCGSAVSANALY